MILTLQTEIHSSWAPGDRLNVVYPSFEKYVLYAGAQAPCSLCSGLPARAAPPPLSENTANGVRKPSNVRHCWPGADLEHCGKEERRTGDDGNELDGEDGVGQQGSALRQFLRAPSTTVVAGRGPSQASDFFSVGGAPTILEASGSYSRDGKVKQNVSSSCKKIRVGRGKVC